MNNEPVAWMSIHEGVYSPSFKYLFSRTKKEGFIPLYTHPHPDNLGLAESIIKQQQAEIRALKEKLEFWVKIADKERLRADRNEQ